MKTLLRTLTAAIALIFIATLATPVLHAQQNLGAIKERMQSRLAEIDALKTAGALGETNQGYLEVRQNAGNATAIASAENADRKIVYTTIAAQQKISAADVRKARAQKIAAESKSGVWLQNAQGAWYTK